MVQARSDGSEATPQHMGESTLCVQALLIYRTRGMPMPDSRSAQRGEMASLCLAHIQMLGKATLTPTGTSVVAISGCAKADLFACDRGFLCALARHRLLPLSVHTLPILPDLFYGRRTTCCCPYPPLTSAIHCDPSTLKIHRFPKVRQALLLPQLLPSHGSSSSFTCSNTSVLIRVELASP